MSSGESSFVASFAGAFEGAISVLLTLLVGYCVAKTGMVNHDAVRKVSMLCTTVFLPCLIVVQMGPELTVKKLAALWIIPVWGVVSTVIAHLLGWIVQATLRTHQWVIVAAGRPNSSALPLLLLKSLETTGVLKSLSSNSDSVSEILRRAQSLILLNVVIQQTITYQLAPQLLKHDKQAERNSPGHDEEDGSDQRSTLKPSNWHRSHITPVVQDRERVGLLQDQDSHSYGTNGENSAHYSDALNQITDMPDIHWPRSLRAIERPVKAFSKWMQPPLIGAIVALLVGIIPPLHRLFYDEQSPLYTSVTQSAKSLGELFVALQMFIVGAQLALVKNVKPGVIPSICALLVRFVIMPGLALLFVWSTAGRGWYIDDKLVWFLLVLIPSGPSAMILANVAELVNFDQGPIAGYLTISYLLAPLMAVVTTLGLLVVDNAAKRL